MTYSGGTRKKQVSSTKNRGVVVVSAFLTALVLFSGFLYIYQANSLVNYSYKIKEHKKELENLKERNSDLEMKIAKMRSPSRLEQQSRKLGMIEIESPIYLEKETEMAVKN